MSSVRMHNFVTRLKNKNVDIRKRAARDLNLYVIFISVYNNIQFMSYLLIFNFDYFR